MTKLFGTDGVRGIVNKDLTCDIALKLGASVAHILKQEYKKDKLTFFIGCDTRISKDMSSAYVMFRDGSSTLQKATNASPLFGRSGRFVIIGNKNIDDKLVKVLECLED